MLQVVFLTFFLNLFLQTYSEVSKFPVGFIFGAATASYQIEGGWNASGKGENIWDHLVHSHPEEIVDHSTGDVACNSYELYQEDIDNLSYLGVDFYRFSISWSRLLPTGFNNYINPDGRRYYENLIQNLLKKGIKPMVTLYHWDLPQPLQDLGGWTNPLMAHYFEDYADVVFNLYGKYVPFWITFNEPGEVCETGYGSGINAPNIRSSGIGDYLCGKTLLLAHARTYHLYQRKYRNKYEGKVGITISSGWYEPKNSNEISTSNRVLRMEFGWWANPIFSKTGDYSKIMRDRIDHFSKCENFTTSRLPKFSEDEVQHVKGTADFLGLNHYTTRLVSSKELPKDAPPSREKDLGALIEQDPRWEPSSAPWLKVVPWGFRKLLNWIKEEYDNPLIYVTENGFADNGELNDDRRIHYHKTYLQSMLDAILTDNCNVRGYAIWSLMDNMEWIDGYTIKFGLYYVDFNDNSRKRIPKASVDYYRSVIKNREISSTRLMGEHLPIVLRI